MIDGRYSNVHQRTLLFSYSGVMDEGAYGMDKLRLVERHGLLLSSHCCCSIIVSEYSFNLNTKVTPPKQTESSDVGMNTQSFQQTDKLQFGGREKR